MNRNKLALIIGGVCKDRIDITVIKLQRVTCPTTLQCLITFQLKHKITKTLKQDLVNNSNDNTKSTQYNII